jgi:large subunit ribosomal protein L9e
VIDVFRVEREALTTTLTAVTVEVKARVVKVTGSRGTIEREFKHMNIDMQHSKETRSIKVDMWFGNRKQLACIRTICSHIENMITGVRIGFLYKMKFVYSHFPINVTVAGDTVEIRNFMGEKLVRKVKIPQGVKAERTKDVKDQLEISGIDITKVSLAGEINSLSSGLLKELTLT